MLVDVVELYPVEAHARALDRDLLVGEQTAQGGDDLADHGQRPAAVDADLARQRIPPRTDPQMIRPGARSSRVEKVLARRAALRVQMSTTPEPILIRSVAAANAAIGTMASRTSRLSACQTALKPAASAWRTYSMPSPIGWASWRYRATG